MSALFNNKIIYKENLNNDLFMKGFLQNLYLRSSCYNCKFKSKERVSDITIADFWGIENVIPEMDDDKGVSLVIINSERGKDILKILQDKVIVKKVDYKEAIKYNKAAIESALYNKKRSKFFRDFTLSNYSNINELIKKYTKTKIYIRLLRFPYRVLKFSKRIFLNELKNK